MCILGDSVLRWLKLSGIARYINSQTMRVVPLCDPSSSRKYVCVLGGRILESSTWPPCCGEKPPGMLGFF